MKKIIYPILLSFLLLASVCFAEHEYTPQQIKKHNIKEITIYLYPLSEKDQEKDISKTDALYKQITYDSHGYPIKMDKYKWVYSGKIWMDTLNFTYENKYNSYNDNISEIIRYTGGKANANYLFKYNDEGELTQEDNFSLYGPGFFRLERSSVYQYNEKPLNEKQHIESGMWLSLHYNTAPSKQVSEKIDTREGGENTKSTYQYDASGKCIKEITYSMETDSLWSTNDFTYNEAGYMTKITWKLPDGEIRGEICYIYDELGNVIEKIDSRIISNEITKYLYTDDWLIKTESTYRLNGNPIFKYVYEYVKM